MKQFIRDSILIDDATGASEEYYLTPVHPDGGEWELVALFLTPFEDVAVAGTNFRTVTPKNGGTACAAAWTSNTGGDALTEGTPYALVPVAGTIREFTANVDALEIDSAHTGTGAALKGQVTAVWERVS